MERLRTQVGWLLRGSARTNAAFDEIHQLRAELDQLGAEVAGLRGDLEASRTESRQSLGDLTARVGSVSDRLEGLGG
jgi:CHAD domain-containing protein